MLYVCWNDIPTCKESGIPTDYLMLRGIFMPAGVTKDQLAYYENLFSKVQQTKEWKQYMESGAFNQTTMKGAEFKAWLEKAEGRHKDLMTEAGFMAKKR